MNTPSLAWSDDLVIGVPVLDREHAALLAMFQRLADPDCAGDRAAVRALLDTLVGEVCRHFDDEEGLMHESRYPDTAAHVESHHLLLKQVNSFITLLDGQPDGWAAANISDFVGRWLLDHIREDDRRFAAYLIAKR
ncbi:bacteriohemerythrin [Azospirillum halopraeferens]|uniref:bacteriohemerythrin n=1 Tax=Azospirillum halopraeferens TaxID=34010 RepID=UPI00040D4C13|nr:hemerythrin family protein [Azospirillum halopraeferens]